MYHLQHSIHSHVSTPQEVWKMFSTGCGWTRQDCGLDANLIAPLCYSSDTLSESNRIAEDSEDADQVIWKDLLSHGGYWFLRQRRRRRG